MRKERVNIVYLKHIRDAIQKINQYVSNHTFSDFSTGEWDRDAVVRNLEIIGEAANNLDDKFRNQYSYIPWRAIIDFRNVAAHDYADLDLEIIWSIMIVDLPKLFQQIKSLLAESD